MASLRMSTIIGSIHLVQHRCYTAWIIARAAPGAYDHLPCWAIAVLLALQRV